MFRPVLYNQRGFSLVEMVTAVGMFAVVSLMATATFSAVVEGQRNAIAAQETQENMRYVFEVISKEIRHAGKNPNDGSCEPFIASNKVYNANPAGDILFFVNKDGQCVSYYLVNGRFMIEREEAPNPPIVLPITSNEVNVSDLSFIILDDGMSEFHSVQPRVTVKMKVEMAGGKTLHKQKMTMQTTIGSRYYE